MLLSDDIVYTRTQAKKLRKQGFIIPSYRVLAGKSERMNMAARMGHGSALAHGDRAVVAVNRYVYKISRKCLDNVSKLKKSSVGRDSSLETIPVLSRSEISLNYSCLNGQCLSCVSISNNFSVK